MELPPYSPEANEPKLIDVTERTRAQLTGLLKSREALTIKPPSLQVVAPGREVSWNDYVDKGCRGGWTEHKTTVLDDSHYQVDKLSKEYGAFYAELSRDGKHVGALHLNTERVAGALFFEDSTAQLHRDELTPADTFIEQFTHQPYSHIHRIPEYFKDRFDVVAQSRNPLENPLTLRSRDNTYALQDEIEGIELLSHEDGTLVKLHLTSPHPSPTSNWIPLEHLKFDMKERDPKSVLNQRLYRSAMRLLAYYDTAPIHQVDRQSPDVSEMNALIEKSILPIKYFPDTSVQDRLYDKPRFLVATPTQQGLENVRHVEGARRIFESPYINVSELRATEAAVWVIDHGSDLAMPLTEPTLAVKPDSTYNIHLIDYLLK